MFTLKDVVPWGRSFGEYRRMFALTDDDLTRRMLGCGDGPASFNADATQRGHDVISCDPIYRFDRPRLQERIAATFDDVLAQTRLNAHEFVWGGVRDLTAAGCVVTIETVPYEFQRGGNEMMRVRGPGTR
jgi:hypothetical protein